MYVFGSNAAYSGIQHHLSAIYCITQHIAFTDLNIQTSTRLQEPQENATHYYIWFVVSLPPQLFSA